MPILRAPEHESASRDAFWSPPGQVWSSDREWDVLRVCRKCSKGGKERLEYQYGKFATCEQRLSRCSFDPKAKISRFRCESGFSGPSPLLFGVRLAKLPFAGAGLRAVAPADIPGGIFRQRKGRFRKLRRIMALPECATRGTAFPRVGLNGSARAHTMRSCGKKVSGLERREGINLWWRKHTGILLGRG